MRNKKVYILFIHDKKRNWRERIVGAYSSKEKLDKVLDNELDDNEYYFVEEVELQ